MKNFYLFVGESGSGKTTLVNALCEYFNATQVSSYTTRPPRYKNEKGHVFVTNSEFDKLKNDLIAYTYYNGNQYGATNQQVEENDFYVIDPAGVDYFRKHYNGKKKFYVIYICTSECERLSRMLARCDKIKTALDRIFYDRDVFATNYYTHHVIHNDVFEQALLESVSYIMQMEANKDLDDEK